MIGHRFAARLHRRLHQPAHVVAQLAQLARDARAHLLERQAAVILVDVIGRLHQLARGIVDVGQQHAVLDIAARIDDHQQNAFFGQAQKFDLLEHRLAPRRQHHTGELRQRRQHLRRAGDDFLRLVLRLQAHAGVDRVLVDVLHREQGVDEDAVTARGRNAAGRRMRTGNIAHFLEIGHDVADGRRRQVEAGNFRQRARADRQAVGDVALDERLQQGLSAGIE